MSDARCVSDTGVVAGCAREKTAGGRGTVPPSTPRLRKPRRRGGKRRAKAELRISRRRGLQQAAKRTSVAKSERTTMSRRTSDGSAVGLDSDSGGVAMTISIWIE
ncbi:hypothetical protein U9M48_009990 [Paspalum notatum var. saurae]|uniref:Uncharacterized protein n=1 Tax=Paspalum notatum var. saurae TaxID=547442 RepID=A0AAQ3WFS5_PASNO